MKRVLKAISEKCIWPILILALSMAGCTPTTTSYSSELRIVPLSNRSTFNLNAESIIQMMRRVGFTDEQIRELGADLHDSLSQAGAARIEINNMVEAIFAIHDDCVYISTRSRGSFVYNVKTGWLDNNYLSRL